MFLTPQILLKVSKYFSKASTNPVFDVLNINSLINLMNIEYPLWIIVVYISFVLSLYLLLSNHNICSFTNTYVSSIFLPHLQYRFGEVIKNYPWTTLKRKWKQTFKLNSLPGPSDVASAINGTSLYPHGLWQRGHR